MWVEPIRVSGFNITSSTQLFTRAMWTRWIYIHTCGFEPRYESTLNQCEQALRMSYLEPYETHIQVITCILITADDKMCCKHRKSSQKSCRETMYWPCSLRLDKKNDVFREQIEPMFILCCNTPEHYFLSKHSTLFPWECWVISMTCFNSCLSEVSSSFVYELGNEAL